MPQNPAKNCCPNCPATGAPTTLTCTIGGASFSLTKVNPMMTQWTGSGGSLCGSAINIIFGCGAPNSWSVSVAPMAAGCSNGQASIQVLNSNPIRANVQYTPPGACCQTSQLNGTINQ